MLSDLLKRREFMTLLGGAAAAWPLAARAQQPDRMRRIGVLMGLAADDPDTLARLAAFRLGLEKRGWLEGRNLRIDTRFAPASANQAQVLAKELIALQPDVILAQSTPRCSERAARFQSCSWASPTLSVQDLSRACRGRAAMSPA
jgi:putative ABC transport system substrate-binding protein